MDFNIGFDHITKRCFHCNIMVSNIFILQIFNIMLIVVALI